MNDPAKIVLDIDEQRRWIIEHKSQTGFSWTVLQAKTGLSSALSVFAGGKYQGDNDKIAEAIFRYRQLLVSQASLALQTPDLPPYFETPTTRRMMTIFSMCHRGRIGVIASAPGTSKSETAKHYAASVSNVWRAVMKKSNSGLMPMQIAVLKALGITNTKGAPWSLSEEICRALADKNALLIIDEAQHLGEPALEEIRAWHDETGVGICLVGNEDVLLRLQLGSRKDALARLASRVGPRLVFRSAAEGDAMALADAWNINDEKVRRFIVRLAGRPGNLRTCSQVLEQASMLAALDRAPLSVSHCEDAWSQFSAEKLA